MKPGKKALLLLILTIAAAILGACSAKNDETRVYGKLLAVFEEAGYPAALEGVEADAAVPIYNASVWKRLKAGEESALVYFDESNRADYLLTMIDQTPYTVCTHYGQRFILLYQGTNPDFTAFLEKL